MKGTSKEKTMQNVPDATLEAAADQFTSVKVTNLTKGDSKTAFSDVFEQHTTMIENELAMAPVSTTDKMLETAPTPQTSPTTTTSTTTTASVATARTESTEAAAAKEAREAKHAKEDAKAREKEERMTKEDLEKVREDLEEYGLSEEEIKAIEEKVNSEEGMTWGEFVSTLSDKMEQMRQVTLSDDQKTQLNSFFAKFGFSDEESATLISQLENGEQDKVMSALQARLAELPKSQQLLLTKDEVEAFSSAMSFSKEFTAKVQEMVGSTSTAKDVKEAFTMIRQEMAEMDAKDTALVKAVGKAFVQSMESQGKESTAAKDIEAAVDLTPRVSEESVKTEAKAQTREDFRDAMESRKESMATDTARKTDKQSLPVKAETDVADDQADADTDTADDPWNNFFSKLKDETAQTNSATATKAQTKADGIESVIKTDTSDLTAKTQTQTNAWEKISAPKVMQQVENAIYKNLSNGTKQLTLQLTPENLGKLSVVLQVQGKEVNAVIRADSAEAAKIISDNIESIRASLENQGLKVEKLDVQTGLTGDQGSMDWSGSDQHNLARDREVMTAMRNHMRAMRGESTASTLSSQGTIANQNTGVAQGIHVIA
jgi:flagellar hook-length control protein FliK